MIVSTWPGYPKSPSLEVATHEALRASPGVDAALEIELPPGAEPGGESLRVVAANAQRCRDPEGAALLDASGADVFLLSELDHGMARSGQRHTAHRRGRAEPLSGHDAIAVAVLPAERTGYTATMHVDPLDPRTFEAGVPRAFLAWLHEHAPPARQPGRPVRFTPEA